MNGHFFLLLAFQNLKKMYFSESESAVGFKSTEKISVNIICLVFILVFHFSLKLCEVTVIYLDRWISTRFSLASVAVVIVCGTVGMLPGTSEWEILLAPWYFLGLHEQLAQHWNIAAAEVFSCCPLNGSALLRPLAWITDPPPGWDSFHIHKCNYLVETLWFQESVMLASPHTALNDVAIFPPQFSVRPSVVAVEQLLPLGCCLPYPGVFAAGELLKWQKIQDLPQVSTVTRLPPQLTRPALVTSCLEQLELYCCCFYRAEQGPLLL